MADVWRICAFYKKNLLFLVPTSGVLCRPFAVAWVPFPGDNRGTLLKYFKLKKYFKPASHNLGLTEFNGEAFNADK